MLDLIITILIATLASALVIAAICGKEEDE